MSALSEPPVGPTMDVVNRAYRPHPARRVEALRHDLWAWDESSPQEAN